MNSSALSERPLPGYVRDLLSSPPARGDGLHRWLFCVARALHLWRSPDAVVALLRAKTTGLPVKPNEVEDAVENSRAFAWRTGGPILTARLPAWPKLNHEQREAITSAGQGVADLWETSPVRLGASGPHAEEMADALFPADALLCVGRNAADFATLPRSAWRGKLANRALIVPSPMSAPTGLTQGGKESAHTLANTGPRRFLVVEQDTGTADEQAAVILHLAERAPLALVVHSGGKSLHGWFFCEGQSDGQLRSFLAYAVSLGADRALWTRSQFARMPEGTRENGARQPVLYFNPEVVPS